MFRRRPARLLLSSLAPHRNQFSRIVFEFLRLSPFLILGCVAITPEAISLRFRGKRDRWPEGTRT
jgi:hypothetical protein